MAKIFPVVTKGRHAPPDTVVTCNALPQSVASVSRIGCTLPATRDVVNVVISACETDVKIAVAYVTASAVMVVWGAEYTPVASKGNDGFWDRSVDIGNA